MTQHRHQNDGDFDEPEPDFSEVFHQTLLKHATTGLIVPSQIRSQIDNFEAIKIPSFAPVYMKSVKVKKTRTVLKLADVKPVFCQITYHSEIHFKEKPLTRYTS